MGMRRRGRSADEIAREAALSKEVERRAPEALFRAAGLFVARTKELLSTPGRGRLRHARIDQLGRGSFTVKAGVRRLVRTGVPRTKIDLTDRASAPGDPPAPDTGALRDSIHMELVQRTTIREPTVVRVGSNLIYAEPLEYGSVAIRGRANRKAGRGRLGVSIGSLAPRPFLRPAFEMVRSEMGDAIVASLRIGGERPVGFAGFVGGSRG